MKPYLLLIFIACLVLTVAGKKKDQAPQASTELCQASMPTLSIGDYNLTQNNFMKFKKQNKLFVLGIADSQCRSCCQSEPMLKVVSKLFADGHYTYRTKKNEYKIPVFRLDLAARNSYVGSEGLTSKNNPSVWVYYDGTYYEYDLDFKHPILLIHFINRLLHPTITLKT